ncbi:MAG TPA: glycosyltransferase family 39 protein [Bradyrhizobium sp.]|jgi:4-amino-4-deoxy-L-arabinose transferase-like glycosyltransferase
MAQADSSVAEDAGTPATESIKAAFWRQPVVWLVALLVAIVHAATAGRYDAQRNELYFLVCGWHPDFGYVDQPPLVPLIAAATQIFGVNIWLLRLPATLAAVGLVLLCAAFARLLGGEGRAAALAAIAAGIAPGLAGLTSHLTTSTFEPIAWTAAAFLLTRAILRDTRSDLIRIGLLAGAAMEAKWGIAVWLVALAAGVVATPARRMLFWWQLGLGIAIAALLVLPNLLWQWQHGWPFFEVILPHLDSQKNFTGPFWQFEWRQALAMNIVLAPLWLAGAIGPFVDRRLAAALVLSLAFLLTTAFYYLQRGTNYYLFPVYPTMFAVGAVQCERLAVLVTRAWMVAALGVSALFAPLTLPILEPAQLQRYMAATGIRPAPIEAAGVGAPLTQSLSDEFGWRDLAGKVAAIVHRLSPEDRARAVILASNYGEAAAIDVFGSKDGLPPVLSGQNQYWLWGPRGHDGSLIIHVGGDIERWRRICGSVEAAGSFGNPYTMPYENNRAIFICRDLRMPLEQLWPRLKRFR